uniref:Uncharacterized protein n=1 Tax=Avena sativa TaxID=4498 RepID=A0ACD5YEU7_AVESA
MMVDPLSVVTAILTVAQLIRSAASTASQNKSKCLEVAERANNLAYILPCFAHTNDAATARVLERLRDAVGEALRLVRSCQGGVGGMFNGSKRAAQLDGVDKQINNCIMDLNLISQARANGGKPAAAAQTGVHVDYHSSYYQAHGGGASTAHVVWTPPTPQHAWSTPQHGYYQPPPGYAPYQAYYPAPSASGSNLSSLYTLPTVNKIFKHMFG